MTDYLDVTRSATINASTEVVAAQIVDFRNWETWSPWDKLDPNLNRVYGGSDAGVGATYEWSGNRKAGAGNMAITDVSHDEIRIDLNFTKPFKSASKTNFAFTSNDQTTTVEWTVRTPKTFMTRVMGLFMNFEKMVGTDLETGLAQLKTACEHVE